ncbi:sensor histidine kinase [Methanolacinia petrolearia]|uniref:sensor histidine kinase n=1 Tax=Methanolacinia petrolearia TaxID=54120 RepID=UPI003BAB80C0
MDVQIEESKRELSRVLELLKDEPRGLSITDLSRALKLNRNSVSKYLNMLLISGHVELRSIGVAKVYFLSKRVPISAMLDYSSDAIVVLNRNMEIVVANESFLSLTGIEFRDIIKMKIAGSGIPVVTDPGVYKEIVNSFKSDSSSSEMEWGDGSGEYFYRIKFIPTVFDEGSPGLTVIIEDISQIKKTLLVKERMLEEVHMRVRSNLAVVNSLLNIQSGKLRNPEAVGVLASTQRRIQALALVHENLGLSESGYILKVEDYIRELSADLVEGLGIGKGNIVVKTDAIDVDLYLDEAVYCGFIINELLMNSYMHAFPEGAAGEISVSLGEDDGIYRFSYADNGRGFPPGMNLESPESTGLMIIRRLVEDQLGGIIEIHPGHGVVFEIAFGK